MPSIALVLIVMFEPMLYGAGWDRVAVGAFSDSVRLMGALIVLAMMYYYARHTYLSDDARLQGKKGLWIWILVLGNVLAVPVFWYLYVFQAHEQPGTGHG